MRLRVVVVGKPRDVALASLVHEYEARAARYWPLEAIEVREGRGEPEKVRALEGEALRDAVGTSRLFAVDERGERFTSAEFADWVQGLREAARDASFVIGGAHGLDPGLLTTAEKRITLAPWTLPHELARVVLAEQLYRAGTIVRREPYHK